MRIPLLDENAGKLINAYNCALPGQRYNKIAESVYDRRANGEALSPQFESAVLDGLMGFGMGITIKGGSEALKPLLQSCLGDLRKNEALGHLRDCCLSSADLMVIGPIIKSAYDRLALRSTLHPTKESHVGATKTLHWLFPELFIILDRNVARAFRTHFGVRLRNSTQPGYSFDKYFLCLVEAQKEIQIFGVEEFRRLEPGTPEARIFDKIAFVVGQQLRRISTSTRSNP